MLRLTKESRPCDGCGGVGGVGARPERGERRRVHLWLTWRREYGKRMNSDHEKVRTERTKALILQILLTEGPESTRLLLLLLTLLTECTERTRGMLLILILLWLTERSETAPRLRLRLRLTERAKPAGMLLLLLWLTKHAKPTCDGLGGLLLSKRTRCGGLPEEARGNLRRLGGLAKRGRRCAKCVGSFTALLVVLHSEFL